MNKPQAYALWALFVRNAKDETIPHCDSRILHHPTECTYCDRPEWQVMRSQLKIAHTGKPAPEGWFVCPADFSRPAGASNDHRRWGGNKPTSATGDVSWPRETTASVIMYGDKGGRGDWPLPERVKRAILRPWESFKMRRKGWRKDGIWWIYDG